MKNESESAARAAARAAYLAAHAKCKINYYSRPADYGRAHAVAHAASDAAYAAHVASTYSAQWKPLIDAI